MSKKHGISKFLLGASIGAGLGMLMSKKTGKENLDLLKIKGKELIEKAKKLDSKEVIDNVEKKVNDIMDELSTLDKEKTLKIAKKKALELKDKSEDLVEYVVEKGTPVMEKTASALREKVIATTKQFLNKLEKEQE